MPNIDPLVAEDETIISETTASYSARGSEDITVLTSLLSLLMLAFGLPFVAVASKGLDGRSVGGTAFPHRWAQGTGRGRPSSPCKDTPYLSCPSPLHRPRPYGRTSTFHKTCP